MGELLHGHFGSVLVRATVRRLRTAAIEFGMCRSGRVSGASGSVTPGNGRSRELRGEIWCRGGNGAALGNQKAVCGNTERGMVVKSAPSAPLIIAEAEFLLQPLIIALDPPSQLGEINQTLVGDTRAKWQVNTWSARLLLPAARSATILWHAARSVRYRDEPAAHAAGQSARRASPRCPRAT